VKIDIKHYRISVLSVKVGTTADYLDGS